MKELDDLTDLFLQTQNTLQKQASRAVDSALVVRNWLFGWYLVEFEHADADRAQLYDKRLFDDLSDQLKSKGVKGTSPTNLRKFRQFFQAYAEIQQTASVESSALQKNLTIQASDPSHLLPQKIGRTLSVESHSHLSTSFLQQLATTFPLGWSQYVTLLTLDDPAERRFYEIESQQNQWSVREPDRQISSSLYQRLALSRDKDEIRRLAEEGQLVEKAADLIKNPLILEFLDLQESTSYSESDLESAIIDKLETFLLELGKSCLFEARQKRFTFDNDHLHPRPRLPQPPPPALLRPHRPQARQAHPSKARAEENARERLRSPRQTPRRTAHHRHRPQQSHNEVHVELTLPKDANIFASKYQLDLPSKEELKEELEAITTSLGGQA